MQPTLCSRCKKNIATVFITRMEGDKTVNEGLCLKCAKSLGLPQVNEMMQRMGITDEDLDNLNNEMMQALDSIENVEELPGGEDDEEAGKTATFPFLNRLFNNGGEPAPKEEIPAEDGSRREKKEGKPNGKRKFLEGYCISLNRKAKEGRLDPVIGRAEGHSDPNPPPEEQPRSHRGARRGQDRHRRGPCPTDRCGGCALQAAG